MTLTRKGSRRVRVGDTEFLWRIRPRPTYRQAVEKGAMTVAIQAIGEGPRSVLVVDLCVTRPDNLLAPHETQLRPDRVRRIILAALADGWDPMQSRGATLRYPIIRDSV